MHSRERALRLLRRSVTELCSWRSSSKDLDTSKYRFLATITETWCICMNVIALYSDAIRRLVDKYCNSFAFPGCLVQRPRRW